MTSLLLGLLLPALAFGGSDHRAFTPPSGVFTAKIPGDWHAFEEREPSGLVVHILGPDSGSGAYRAGIDVHWVEAGLPGARPFKGALRRLRRKDRETLRTAGSIRRVSVSGNMARVFEVRERRRLPVDSAPAVEQTLHHYTALLPSPGGYFVIRLSSVEEDYLDFRSLFFDFLDSFRVPRKP